jgi:hypothetical protein
MTKTGYDRKLAMTSRPGLRGDHAYALIVQTSGKTKVVTGAARVTLVRPHYPCENLDGFTALEDLDKSWTVEVEQSSDVEVGTKIRVHRNQLFISRSEINYLGELIGFYWGDGPMPGTEPDAPLTQEGALKSRGDAETMAPARSQQCEAVTRDHYPCRSLARFRSDSGKHQVCALHWRGKAKSYRPIATDFSSRIRLTVNMSAAQRAELGCAGPELLTQGDTMTDEFGTEFGADSSAAEAPEQLPLFDDAERTS